MFTDKNRPLSVSVSSVSHFYAAPGVKSCDTDDTDTHPSLKFGKKPQIHGYILCMETATGTWYYSGFHSDNTRLAWTQDQHRCKIIPGRERNQEYAAKQQAEIADLFGPAAIIGKITARPVTIVAHRNILIDEEQS